MLLRRWFPSPTEKMPSNKKSRKPRQPRKSRKRRAGNSKALRSVAQITRLSLNLNVLPRKLYRTLCCSTTVPLYSAAVTGATGSPAVFNLGSIHDPYTSLGGLSAYGHDQLSTWYSTYQVMNVRAVISGSTPGGTAELAVVYKIDVPGAYLSVGGFSYDRACMTPMCGVFLVGPAGNDRTNKATLSIAPWKALGITKKQWVDEYDTYSSPFGSSPAAGTCPTLQVGVCSPSGTGSESLTVQILLYFTVECTQPKNLPVSS